VATSTELINALIAQGYSRAAIGRAVGRDSSLIGQIAKGAKPGTNLNAALDQLLSTGEVQTPPFRRTTKAGTVAKVRARRGHEATVPLAPKGQRIRTVTKSTQQPGQVRKPAPQGQRNRLTHTVNRLPTGRELNRVTVPKSGRAENRQEGGNIAREAIARAAATGRRISGTVWAEVRRKDGTRERIPVQIGGKGGYSAQSALDAIDSTRGGAFAWLTNQVANRYPEYEGGFTIVGFDIDSW